MSYHPTAHVHVCNERKTVDCHKGQWLMCSPEHGSHAGEFRSPMDEPDAKALIDRYLVERTRFWEYVDARSAEGLPIGETGDMFREYFDLQEQIKSRGLNKYFCDYVARSWIAVTKAPDGLIVHDLCDKCRESVFQEEQYRLVYQ